MCKITQKCCLASLPERRASRLEKKKEKYSLKVHKIENKIKKAKKSEK